MHQHIPKLFIINKNDRSFEKKSHHLQQHPTDKNTS